MTRLGKGALAAGVAGGALFLSMFVGWFGVAGLEATESGWSSMGWFGVGSISLAIASAVAFALVLYTRASLSAPPALATLACGIGALAFVVVGYRIIDPPGGGEVSREIGVWLGFAATATIALGGWLGMQEEGPP